ncbi:hypothetical protein QNO21_12415 [Microbacterium sp. zg-Y818]|uniref:hypothetical protein n=1 Tax=unclassified Microbacterium TaxID=2609290 RepID=UPI00214AE623|nr:MULTISPECIES: hypothetical protein [unclassified Microbacterium]MCR2799927.1 hypothetical protein [Microbacterium sp. zg.Y818]WIM21906.1 hypothetical protein QNO21_12415 [Microbacterium sp. zg-Y818]
MRVRDLPFPFSVTTFDDPRHPGGLVVATTAPLGGDPAFHAFAAFPDGRFAWLASTATWGRDDHPWALVRRFHIDGDATADLPDGSRDPRLSGGGELTVTDDLEAGRRMLTPGRTPSRPARTRATAWAGITPGSPGDAMSVMVQDGVGHGDPATVTVLSGGGVPSGLALQVDPQLAARLREGAAPVTTATALPTAGVPARVLRSIPAQLTLVAEPPSVG